MAKTNTKKVSNTILLRVYFLFALFVLFGVIILLRIFMLQLNSDSWTKIGEEERIFFKKVVADRGNILSEDGTILATSMPFYKIAIDPTMVDSLKIGGKFDDSLRILGNKLYQTFGVRDTLIKDSLYYYYKMRAAIKNKDRHLYLTNRVLNYKEFLSAKTWTILNRKKKEGGCLIVEKYNNKRFYPYGEMGRVTLGTVIDDTMGGKGIEFSYNRSLRGKDGYFLAQKIPGNHFVPMDQFGEADASDGLDVVTTLDVDLQDIVETALRKGVIANQAKAGTAILMEVGTGKIKAIANYPETYNYAIASLIEPGSTFKAVSALAALEAKIIDINDSVDTGDGTLKLDNKTTISDAHGYGKITYQDVFAKSSNVGIAKTTIKGFKDNPKKFIEYVEKFGFSKPSNEQIKGEPKPKMNRPGDKLWSGATLPSMSIGYSIQVTPLQMLSFYNAIANGGKMVKPYMVSQIRDNSEILQNFTPKNDSKMICSLANLEKMKKMLTSVVDYGTAKNIKGTSFKIAGKTGTARKNINGVYVARYQASFVGFFPAENPIYTCYVMVDEPQAGDIYGADVSAPIFKEIAEETYALRKDLSGFMVQLNHAPLKKPAPRIMNAKSAEQIYKEMEVTTSGIPEGADWVATRNNGHQINFREYKATGRVPDVTGLSARDAVNLLEEMGVSVTITGIGKVRQQSLLPGTKIGKGTSISLVLN